MKLNDFKARLVALGYRQTYGADYADTCPPVGGLYSIRIFMALQSSLG